MLIVLEGIDGSGKSTLQKSLAAALRSRGLEVVETKEPTNGPIGQKIRALALGDRESISPAGEARLFHEDRRAHVDSVVRPALARRAVVIQNRSYFSTVAYQGERGLDPAALLSASESIAPRPDLLIVLDLPVELALERIRRTRDRIDGFEERSRLERIRQTFLGLPEAKVIDATLEPDEVTQRVLTFFDVLPENDQ